MASNIHTPVNSLQKGNKMLNRPYILSLFPDLFNTVKPVQNSHSKNRPNKDLNDKWSLNEGIKYCRILPLEHSAILLTCIKQ